jgi:hypothetical protein
VKPFIKNKINKTVVDVLLLEEEDIVRFTIIEEFCNLNAF